MPAPTDTSPLYRALAERIAAAIKAGTLEAGLVLLEGQLSDVLGSSRATVRNALSMLAEDGMVDRFDGRGFIIGGCQAVDGPIRRRVSAADFPQDETAIAAMLPASDRIIPEVEEAVSTAVAFGHYRVNEQRLADSYGVSRPIVREVLWRLRELGLVEKDLHSPWLAGPLTARAIFEDREMRVLLEPNAMLISAPRLASDEIAAMIERVAAARSNQGPIKPTLIEQIEIDLHENCLKQFTNARIRQILRNGQTTRMVTSLFARFIGLEADAPDLGEHAAILDEIAANNWKAAAELHASHLLLEGKRTLARLKVLSVIQEPLLPDYLERIV